LQVVIGLLGVAAWLPQADLSLLVRGQPENAGQVRDGAGDDAAVEAPRESYPWAVLPNLVLRERGALERLIVVDSHDIV
jgi:hypothetical protein